MVASVSPFHLLMADDDEAFRATLRSILAPYFRLFEAESGEQAVEIVETETVHIVLLDMHMHRLDGLETLRIVKSHNEVAPCILITADASEQLRDEAARADAWSVLSKPISRRHLVHTVWTALEDAYEMPSPFESDS